MKRLIRHYIAVYRLARINNTFSGTLCAMLFRPF